MKAHNYPRAHAEVEIHFVEDGCVVYLPETDQVHFLNATVSLVLDLCDGQHDVHAIERELATLAGGTLEFDVRTAVLQPLTDMGVLVSGTQP